MVGRVIEVDVQPPACGHQAIYENRPFFSLPGFLAHDIDS